MSATTTSSSSLPDGGIKALLSKGRFRAILVVWTLAIWSSRLRNIVTDDELVGSERTIAIAIAGFLILAATAVGISLWRRLEWHARALGVLVVAGIARFTTRGVAILASSEWDTGFKVVHTVLWAITVILSVLAAREYSKVRSSAWVSS